MSSTTSILGGGISGLSAAYYLLKHSPKHGPITLLESSSRVGGWVKTIQTPEGIIFEQGPRTIRPKGLQGANTLQLIDDLNLASLVKPISKDHPTAKNRLIYVNNKLHNLPASIFSIFKTQTPFSKPLIFALFKDLTTKSIPKDDESIYDFTSRRFGKEVADYVISAMICGICAGDAKQISVNFLMSKLFKGEQKHGSVLKGIFKDISENKESMKIDPSPLYKRSFNEKWSVWSIEGGLQTITKALHETIEPNVDVKLNTACTNIEFDGTQVKLQLNNNNELITNNVISSLPANNLGHLVQKQHPELANLLTNIEHVDVAVVNLAYENINLKENAFGLLVPPREKLPILGVIFDSCCFKQDNWTVLTVMMGGAWFKTHFTDKTKDDIFKIACQYVHDILDVPQTPKVYHVDILQKCIPQYTLGHVKRVDSIYEYIEKHKLALKLTGSSYHGVGINDVIMLSKNVIDKMTSEK